MGFHEFPRILGKSAILDVDLMHPPKFCAGLSERSRAFFGTLLVDISTDPSVVHPFVVESQREGCRDARFTLLCARSPGRTLGRTGRQGDARSVGNKCPERA